MTPYPLFQNSLIFRRSSVAIFIGITKIVTIFIKTIFNFFMTEAICRANQWTGFYMITASVMKELKTQER